MIAYILKSAGCMLLLLAVYHLFLEREKMHRFNRYFLLFGLIFSLTVPFITFNITAEIPLSSQISEINQRLAGQPSAPPTYAPPANPAPVVDAPADSSISSGVMLWSLYITIAGFMLVRLLRNLYLLYAKVSRNAQVPYQDATLVLEEDCSVPHSFFSYIFVNKQLYESGHIDQSIFTHELTHARQKHSVDTLFIELLKIVFWFNPVLYFYKKAMQMNHEFLADESVVAGSKDISAYQKLLLKIQSDETALTLASSIHFSITKKRIVMMTKTSTPIIKRLKQLSLIPVVAALVFAFSTHTVSAQDVNSMSLEQLLEAVDAKMQSGANLSAAEKRQLQDLNERIQEKLQPAEPKVPDKPSPPPSQISDQNLLLILINGYGQVQIDGRPTNIEKITGTVKDFISNNGANPELSDSPQEAYISIKTLKETPYKKYIEIFDNVQKVYLYLRNAAAQAEFGENFEALEKGSMAYSKILEQYPQQIFINPNIPSRTPAPPKPTQQTFDFNIPIPPNASRQDSLALIEIEEKYKQNVKKYLAIEPVEENRTTLDDVLSDAQADLFFSGYHKIYRKYNFEPSSKVWATLPNAEERIRNHSNNSSLNSNSLPENPEQARYDLASDYNDQVRAYQNIKPVEANRAKLEASYEKTQLLREQLRRLHEKIVAEVENPKPPSPILKLPENPDERIQKQKGLDEPLPPPVKKDTTDFDQISKKYSSLIDRYLDIKPVKENQAEMERIYKEYSVIYDRWKDSFRESDETKPLAPPPAKRHSLDKSKAESTKADTARYEQLKKQAYQQLKHYQQITPTLQNKEELINAFDKLNRIRDQRDKAKKNLGNATKREERKPPPPPGMKPTSRMLVYYRQHPKLARQEPEILKMALQKHQEMLAHYENAPVTEENRVNLGIRYSQIKINFKNWNEIFMESGTGMQLPPLPEAAWKRLKAHNKSNK